MLTNRRWGARNFAAVGGTDRQPCLTSAWSEPLPFARIRTFGALPAILVLALAGITAPSLLRPSRAELPAVEVIRTPHGGIQPQAVIDARGTVHLLYYTGNPKAGDLHYVRRGRGQAAWSTPVTVNSRPASAIAAGTIRGGQLALGKTGRVHVVWFGSSQSGIKSPGDTAPLLYSRSNETGTAFEPQRNLMTRTTHLDGGPSVAADVEGTVTVAWHANETGEDQEIRRGLFLARSKDEGKSFGAETTAWSEPTGACACCSTKVLADRNRGVWVLYRGAIAGTDRDTYLLRGGASGNLTGKLVDKWKLNACPMASYSLAEGPDGVLGAWETAGQVLWGRANLQGKMERVLAAPEATGNRKHPALAVGPTGEVLLSWTEGTGWQRGGTLAWQRYARDGKPIGGVGRVPGGIPVWGLPTVVARPEGGFTLIH